MNDYDDSDFAPAAPAQLDQRKIAAALGGELACVRPTEVTSMTLFGDAGSRMATSIDVKTRSGIALVSRCLAAAELKVRNAAGQLHEIVHWLAHPVEITDDQSGEIRRMVRLVLIRADGKRISTCSQVVVKTWSILASVYGAGPYSPPVTVRITENQCGEGRSYCQIEDVYDETPSAPTKKGGK